MTELDEATALANRVMDRINADPDDDLAVLARQFLRALEREQMACKGHFLTTLYEIREALGWNDKTSLSLMAHGVKHLRLEIECRDALVKDHLAKIMHLENRIEAEAHRADQAEEGLRCWEITARRIEEAEAGSLSTGESSPLKRIADDMRAGTARFIGPRDACDHDWVIWPETDGQEQRCKKCGSYRKTPKEATNV